MAHPIWPLFDLEVRTPRLTLRYVTDELATDLAELAAGGIHDTATMPFSVPWSDVAPPELGHNTMQYIWRRRAQTTPSAWTIEFAVVVDDVTIGTSGLSGTDFARLRQTTTGSWLGREFQGQGFGKEMRLAMLALAFDGFDADRAITSAWHDNAASIGVTTSLGYTETGRRWMLRREQPDVLVEFEMPRERFASLRRDDITLHGVDAARELLQTERVRSVSGSVPPPSSA